MKNTKNEHKLIAQIILLTEREYEHERIQRKMPGVRYIGEMTNAGRWDSLRQYDLNEWMIDLLMYSEEEIELLKYGFFKKMIHPDDLHFIGDSVDFMNKNKWGCVYDAGIRFITKENKIIWVQLNTTRLSQHSDGSTFQFACNGSIITQSRHNDRQMVLWQKENTQRINHRCAPDFSITEKKVIKYIVNGFSTKQTADAMFISKHTLKTHRRNIYKKAGVHHIGELIALAIELGLN